MTLFDKLAVHNCLPYSSAQSSSLPFQPSKKKENIIMTFLIFLFFLFLANFSGNSVWTSDRWSNRWRAQLKVLLGWSEMLKKKLDMFILHAILLFTMHSLHRRVPFPCRRHNSTTNSRLTDVLMIVLLCLWYLFTYIYRFIDSALPIASSQRH